MRLLTIALISMSYLILSGVSSADNATVGQQIYAALAKIVNDPSKIENIKTTSVPGYYEATIGTNIVYVSEDARFLVTGNIIDLQKNVNLTERSRKLARSQVLRLIDDKETITFGQPKADHVVTVFTDVDCGYCRKMHQMIDTYNEKGITIRYAAFPRAGEKSKSFDKAVAVWCADDKQKAMTDAKSGIAVTQTKVTCNNPVKKQHALGVDLGVTGTPTMFLPDGTMIPGFLPPDKLLQRLEFAKS